MRTLVVNAMRLNGSPTGMRRYIEHLARHWSRMDVPFDRVRLLSPQPAEVPGLEADGKIELVTTSSHSGAARAPLLAWEQVTLSRAARRAAALYCPAYTAPIAYRGRLVVANHGISPLVCREFSLLTRMRTAPLLRLSARRADRVIVNSPPTRGDVIRHLRVDPAKIELIYPAAAELFFEQRDPREVERRAAATLGRPGPYVLFVGKLNPRRNVPNLIEAFARVRARHSLPHHLVIIGPDSGGESVAELAERHGVAAEVIHRPQMGWDELAGLYAGADVFALPTIHEGLSHTLLEAMASATAVLTVRHGTLAQAGAETTLAVPTPSVDDISVGLTRLLLDPALRRELGCAGREEARGFSWERTAAQTLAVLDRVALPADGHRRRAAG